MQCIMHIVVSGPHIPLRVMELNDILQTETVNTNDGILKRACVTNLISWACYDFSDVVLYSLVDSHKRFGDTYLIIHVRKTRSFVT
jgi:hypothetical protein